MTDATNPARKGQVHVMVWALGVGRWAELVRGVCRGCYRPIDTPTTMTSTPHVNNIIISSKGLVEGFNAGDDGLLCASTVYSAY